MRYLKGIALAAAFVFLCGFGGGGSTGGGGGAPTGAAGGDLGGTYPNPTITLTGDVTKSTGSTATTAVGSSNLQQPVMFIGAVRTAIAGGTSVNPTSPPGVANGDLELVYINIGNTTSGTFVPPAGWSAVASCAASGNSNQIAVFSHTASSEGANTGSFSWTTAASNPSSAWASAYRNAAVDVCAASTAAAGTTYTTPGITAVATTDRIVAVGTQIVSGGLIKPTTYAAQNLTDEWSATNTSFGMIEISYPITSTTVAGIGFTSSQSQVWAGVQIGLSFSASTTATAPGALTYSQFGGAFLNFLQMGKGIAIEGNKYQILLPNNTLTGSSNTARGGIGAVDANDLVYNLISGDGGGAANTINIGDSAASNGSSNIALNAPNGVTTTGNFAATTHNISTTTGSISSTTGAIGPTGGGVLQSYGGTLPTCACTGGTPTCTAQTGGSNSAAQLVVTGGTGMTTCTETFSASGAFHAAPVCVVTDANASTTPLAYSVGATSTATMVFDFASATALTVNVICIGH